MPFRVSAKGRRFLSVPNAAASFNTKARAAEDRAATTATEVSRVRFTSWLSGRPTAPPRNGRPTTEGEFASLIEWKAMGNGFVDFETGRLTSRAPYWLIQEIGTGKSARIISFGGSGVMVKSQRGRKLPRGFYWGDAQASMISSNGVDKRSVGLNPTRNQSQKRRTSTNGYVHKQQLYPLGMTPPGGIYREARGTIHREIIGKHYLRDGGNAGFAVLRQALLADYRQMLH